MGERNASYFRQILQSKTDHFHSQCSKWQKIVQLSEKIPEEVQGQIRTTIGQAQLLIDQRFHQFLGLIDNCEFNLGEKPTTYDDLQGFWDMIYIQVDDVEKKFDSLEQLQKDHWEQKVINKNNTTKTKNVKQQPKSVPKTNFGNTSIRNHILMARQNLAEAKARVWNNSNIENNKENEAVRVFEMPAFFVVSSPIRKPSGTPRTCRVSTTPVRPQTKTPLAKNYLPLACVTRSAKRAMLAKNINFEFAEK